MISKLFSIFHKPQPKKRKTGGPEKLLETIRALDNGRGAFARNAYYATEFGVTDRTIRRWLASLVESGRIDITGYGKGRRIHAKRILAVKPQASRMNPDMRKRPDSVRNLSGKRPDSVRANISHDLRSKSNYVLPEIGDMDPILAECWWNRGIDAHSG